MIIDKLGDGFNLKEISNEVSFEEFKTALAKWKKCTTTSPSGRHLGHYKLLLRLNTIDDNNDKINISENILYVYFSILKISLAWGISIKRWQNISTCMIEKIKGNPLFDKIPVIHSFEADYNLFLKIIWSRRTVWNAHIKNRINDGQSGS
jgi:hypothetical protein